MKREFLSLLATMMAIVVMVGAAEARSSVALVNFTNQTWVRADNKKLSADQVRQAIILTVQEMKRKEWVVQDTSDGRLLATIRVRGKHTVVVAISYTDTSFDVAYESSVNMNYKKESDGTEVIHPYYNQWVDKLVKEIKSRLTNF